jgi:hypothetical protein
MKIGPETIQGMIYYDWVVFNKLDSFIFHVGNERDCNQVHGRLLKRQGVKPGVSDYLCLKPMFPYAGLIIELKIKPDKPSALQLKFLETMNANGYLAVVRWSADECIKTTQDYLMMSST